MSLLGGLALGARLLGVWGRIKSGVKWCFATPARAFVTLLLIAIAVLLFRLWRVDGDRDDWRKASGQWEAAARSWETALNKLVVDVEQGRLQAAKMDEANKARVAREMAKIRKDSADDYQKLEADTAAAVGRLRGKLAQIATEDRSGGGAAAMPGDYTARCKAFGAADCDALFAALPGMMAEAEGNTNKLIALQAYVNGILAVDMNGEADSGQP